MNRHCYRSFFFVLLFAYFTLSASSMLAQDKNTWAGYYLFPIRPGKQVYLAGNMGELRRGHFHAGLDIKTEGEEGWPVYAVQDGYVSRIKASATGYGKALYIKHPNGHTSLYGHLQSFGKALDEYVLKKQYEKKTEEVDLYFGEKEFKVKKGEEIAKTGNTGSSAGPHLHFEIRDEEESPLNILALGFKEIVDNLSPHIDMVGLVAMDKFARVEGVFGRHEWNPVRINGAYTVPTPIRAYGRVGLEFDGHDRADGVPNQYGIYKVMLWVNDEVVFHREIDKIAFHQSHFINVFTNYREWKRQRTPIQKAYKSDGNKLPIYKTFDDGTFWVEEGKEYRVKLELCDNYGNESELLFTIIGDQSGKKKNERFWGAKVDIHDNYLWVEQEATSKPGVRVFSGGISFVVAPDYTTGQYHSYLIDLRHTRPDSLEMSGEIIPLDIREQVHPHVGMSVYSELADIEFPPNALYDTAFLPISLEKNTFHIGDPYLPLAKPVTITLKPDFSFERKDKTSAYWINPSQDLEFLSGTWIGENFTFKSKNLGNFTFVADVEAPSIRLIRKSTTEVRLSVRDDRSGIGSFKASVNGSFLLMHFDPRKGVLWSERLNKTIPLKGTFEIEVTDNQGNQKVFRTTL